MSTPAVNGRRLPGPRREHEHTLVALRERPVQIRPQPVADRGLDAALEDHVAVLDPVAQPLGVRLVDDAALQAEVDPPVGVAAVGPQPAEAAEVRRILSPGATCSRSARRYRTWL